MPELGEVLQWDCSSGYVKVCGINISPPHPVKSNNWTYWLKECTKEGEVIPNGTDIKHEPNRT